MSTTFARWRQIADSLSEKEYRDSFVIEEINTGVPFQIRAMRQARGWSQKELAARMGMTQEGVSRLENPDYGKLTLTTLKRLASAFDVGLAVRFVPFSHLVDWAVNFSPNDLAVPDYEHDRGLLAPDPAPLTVHAENSSRLIPPIHRVPTGGYRLASVASTIPPVSPTKAATTRGIDYVVDESTAIQWSA